MDKQTDGDNVGPGASRSHSFIMPSIILTSAMSLTKSWTLAGSLDFVIAFAFFFLPASASGIGPCAGASDSVPQSRERVSLPRHDRVMRFREGGLGTTRARV